VKQIKLCHITAPDKTSHITANHFYYVSLGNGYKQKFPSKRAATAFLNETNRELNIKLYELNFLYSDLLKLYRGSWLYFDKKIPGLNNIEMNCLDKFRRIDGTFNIIIERSHWENGNFFVFSQLQYIIAELKTVCELLNQIFRKRGITSAIYEIDSYLQRADYISTAISIYPEKIKFVAEKLQQVSVLKVI